MQRRAQAAGFGRKVDHEAEEVRRRREAFIAAERQRRAAAPQPGVDLRVEEAFARRPVQPVGAPKSLLLAYLLWFFTGALSGHRFYLGFTTSACIQLGLWMGGWVMILTGVYVAALGVVIAAVWTLADAFLIPGLCRKANERPRSYDVAGAFA